MQMQYSDAITSHQSADKKGKKLSATKVLKHTEIERLYMCK